MAALKKFKKGEVQVLIATDVASRGNIFSVNSIFYFVIKISFKPAINIFIFLWVYVCVNS